MIREQTHSRISERLTHIKVISFDLDDTLWECAPVIIKAEQALYQWMEQNTARITRHCSPDDLLKHRAQFSQGHPEYRVDVTFLRKEALKSLFREFSYSIDRVEEAFEVFYKARSQVELYPHALTVLEALKARYRLAALTNGNADLELVGIDHLFDDIQHGSLTNPPKPDKAMFEKTAAVLDVGIEHILHIGDNPIADVSGGRDAGAMTVWFNQYGVPWPEHLPRADIETDSLTDLPALLA